jgi:glycosyltransferase A (GT-A) superfamily protein (DUF2064 family)
MAWQTARLVRTTLDSVQEKGMTSQSLEQLADLDRRLDELRGYL